LVLLSLAAASLEAQDVLEPLLLAADQGSPDAQYDLGLAYSNGGVLPRDDAEAVRWFRMAADQGGSATTRAETCRRSRNK
jgi:TPR repeat protein